MAVSSRLSSYLDQHGTRYEICLHEHSRSSAETARRAHVAPEQLAKPVVLEDDDGCVVAVVPSDKNVMVGQIARVLGRGRLRLADEARIAALFDDCERGAVSPVGMAWGLETIVDEELEAQQVVYLESGDHERLLRLTHEQFSALMGQQRHGQFSRMPTH